MEWQADQVVGRQRAASGPTDGGRGRPISAAARRRSPGATRSLSGGRADAAIWILSAGCGARYDAVLPNDKNA